MIKEITQLTDKSSYTCINMSSVSNSTFGATMSSVVPDEFVVGYGLDYAERYRNLPYVGVLRRSVYEK